MSRTSRETASERAVQPAAGAAGAGYQPPHLERLGKWRALTLQQTVPIGPGGFLLDPEQTSRLG